MYSPLITSVMRWVASFIESVSSYTWNNLVLEFTCPRVLFTHLLLLFVVWLVRPILIFPPTFLRISYFLALKTLNPSWINLVQNSRSHRPERLCMQYFLFFIHVGSTFSGDISNFVWAHIPPLLLIPLPVHKRESWLICYSFLLCSWNIMYKNTSSIWWLMMVFHFTSWLRSNFPLSYISWWLPCCRLPEEF